MANRNLVTKRERVENNHGYRKFSSSGLPDFQSMRAERLGIPPASLISRAQLEPIQSTSDRLFDTNMSIISMTNPFISNDMATRVCNMEKLKNISFETNSPTIMRDLSTKTSKVMLDSPPNTPSSVTSITSFLSVERNRASRKALIKAKKENDSMVFIDGPLVYTCSQCRTHLTSHDDIISKSFHGRHGRAYLFDQCVNVTLGPEENRRLMTGLHIVCDIHCKRCKRIVGWTYTKAYEHSQKYKEGKFVIEKINLHLEESNYAVTHPAGERDDRWRKRSMSWGSLKDQNKCDRYSPSDMIFEYHCMDSMTSMSTNTSDSDANLHPKLKHIHISNNESAHPQLPDLSANTAH